MHFLFGFAGRINRAKMWAFFLLVVAYYAILGAVVVFILGPMNIAHVAAGKAPLTVLTNNSALPVLLGFIGIAGLALIWAGIAVRVKRLHDRGKSAWWILVFYVLPLVLNLPRQLALLYAWRAGVFFQIARHGGISSIGGPIATIATGAATIITLWAFVELYCLRGTVGDNRYGPDPLARRG